LHVKTRAAQSTRNVRRRAHRGAPLTKKPTYGLPDGKILVRERAGARGVQQSIWYCAPHPGHENSRCEACLHVQTRARPRPKRPPSVRTKMRGARFSSAGTRKLVREARGASRSAPGVRAAAAMLAEFLRWGGRACGWCVTQQARVVVTQVDRLSLEMDLAPPKKVKSSARGAN
jgi:hypothetical protein